MRRNRPYYVLVDDDSNVEYRLIRMPDPDLYEGEQFGDNDPDPEDASPSLLDEGTDEVIETDDVDGGEV